MTREVVTIPATATLREGRAAFETARHGAFPLVSAEGGVAGIVTRGDLLRSDAPDDTRITEIGSADVVSVEPTQPLLTVVRVMLEEDVDHVPVVLEGRLVGICTRSDLLAARSRQLEHELPQPGWLRRPQRSA